MNNKLIISLIVLIVLNGCGVSQMNVYNGKFQAIKSPNIRGNQQLLNEGKNYKVSIEGNYGSNKNVKLNNVRNTSFNGDEFSLPDSAANISYRMINTVGGINISVMNKKKIGFYGMGLGGQPYPYIYGMVGFNDDFFEIGSSLLIGLSNDNASYSGDVIWTENQIDGSWEEFDKINENDIEIIHTFTSATFFTSLFTNGISLNYVGTIGWPWGLLDELPAKNKYNENNDYNISIDMPLLLMNDISVGYKYNAISITIGYNQIVGQKFDGRYSSISGNIGYHY